MNEKAKTRRIPARFGPQTRFKVKPVPAALVRAQEQDRLTGLKDRLLGERLNEVPDAEALQHCRQAANEAAALAWATAYPLLVFPALFDEKAREAEQRLEKQDEIRQRSREMLAL